MPRNYNEPEPLSDSDSRMLEVQPKTEKTKIFGYLGLPDIRAVDGNQVSDVAHQAFAIDLRLPDRRIATLQKHS